MPTYVYKYRRRYGRRWSRYRRYGAYFRYRRRRLVRRLLRRVEADPRPRPRPAGCVADVPSQFHR